MRFITVLGNIAKARRYVAGSASLADEEVEDKSKLAEVLRGLLRRITDIEGRIPPEPLEFEVEVPAAGTFVRLEHGFNRPVRYFVTTWTRKTAVGSAYPTSPPNLVMDETSDSNNLVLRSSVAGRAIIRVEPVQAGIGI